MDPLSPVASCLDVLGALIGAVRLFSALHDARSR